MLNHVSIMGRLTRDPELRKTGEDTSVCSFALACDRDVIDKSTGERGVDFINVTAWRSKADFVSKYFVKGQLAVVEGRLQVRSYTDKEGVKRTSVDVVAENIYFGGSKKDNPASSRGDSDTAAPVAASAPVNVPGPDEDDGELPF